MNSEVNTVSQNGNRTPRLHRLTLVEMNKPVFTARRNVAHERVVQVLRQHMLASSKEERTRLYKACLRLTSEALDATLRSQMQHDTPLVHYLELLRDTISASEALVKHEMTLVREAEEFRRILSDEFMQQFQLTDDVFSASEMNILDCIDNLLNFGETLLQQDTRARLSSFNADDQRRYDLARAEYEIYYCPWNNAETA